MAETLARAPIYQQVNQRLRSLIHTGEFQAGARFLTEREISERYSVSRATANKALSNLVSEGLLEFRKGLGTFVRARGLDYDVRALVSFTERALAAGRKPATRVLRFACVKASEAAGGIEGALEVRPHEMLFYMERLRLADAQPLILERRHVVARHCPGLSRRDAGSSIYRVWTEEYRLAIAGAEQTIRAVAIPQADARALEVRSGAAGLLVTSTGRLAGGEPLWFERTLYRGDAYEFHNRLGGLHPAACAVGQFCK